METRGHASSAICSTPGCRSVASMSCPNCRDLGLPPSLFCTQVCFKASWRGHKALHSTKWIPTGFCGVAEGGIILKTTDISVCWVICFWNSEHAIMMHCYPKQLNLVLPKMHEEFFTSRFHQNLNIKVYVNTDHTDESDMQECLSDLNFSDVSYDLARTAELANFTITCQVGREPDTEMVFRGVNGALYQYLKAYFEATQFLSNCGVVSNFTYNIPEVPKDMKEAVRLFPQIVRSQKEYVNDKKKLRAIQRRDMRVIFENAYDIICKVL